MPIKEFILYLCFFCVLCIVHFSSFAVDAVDNESVNTLPDSNTATFRSASRTFWQNELPDILSRYFPYGWVRSGGIFTSASTSGINSPSFSTEAFTSSGNRVTANSAGGPASIAFGSAVGCAATDTGWVIISAASGNSLSNFERSGTSNYFVDCVSSTQPTLPSDSAWLMRVTIVSSAITAVTNLRESGPFAYRMNVRAPPYSAAGDDSTDDGEALASALNHTNAVSRVIVYVPAGIYRTGRSLTVPSNVCLVGDGAGITEIKLHPTYTITSNNAIINLGSASNACVRHLTINVNRANITGLTDISGIGGTFTDSDITDVEVKNTIGGTIGGTGIYCNPGCARNLFAFNKILSIGSPRTNSLVSTNASASLTRGGSTVGGYVGLTVDAHIGQFVEVSGTGITTTAYRVHSNTTTALGLLGQMWDQASGAYTARLYSAMDIGDGLFVKGYENRLIGNEIERVADACITTASSDDVTELEAHGNIVIGNHCRHAVSNSGMTVGPAGGGIIQGNFIRNTGQHCFIVASLGSVPIIPPLITDNVCAANGLDGINNDYDRAVLSRNTIHGAGRYGIFSTGRGVPIHNNTILIPVQHGIVLNGGTSQNTNASATVTNGGTTVGGYTGLTVNKYVNYWVFVNGEANRVLSNTATTLTVQDAWASATGTYTANIYISTGDSHVSGNTIRLTNASGNAAIATFNAAFGLLIDNNDMYADTAPAGTQYGILIRDSPAGKLTIPPTNRAAGLAVITDQPTGSVLSFLAVSRRRRTLTYAVTVLTNASLADTMVITATDGGGLTIQDPRLPTTGQQLTYIIRNASGGIMGDVSFDTAFKVATFTKPANGFSRSITVEYDGTNWVEISRTTSDVPN